MAAKGKKIKVAEYGVFFDFDNTITTTDVLDDIIKRFSINDDWVAWEQEWEAHAIGSAECLRKQLAGVRVNRARLLKYLAGIKVDPHIHGLLTLLKRNHVKPAIVSDSFSWVIKSILKHQGISGFRVYAHAARFRGDRLFPSFAHRSTTCDACAHCKKENLAKLNPARRKVMYIGDGFSDTCAAESADLVFAKGVLLDHFRRKKKPCVAFTHLGDVQRYLEEHNHGTSS